MSQTMQRARDTYDLERSPSSRKKQRLSSPTYDEQYELSQVQIQAFDELDKRLSQRPSSEPRLPLKRLSQPSTPRSRRRRSEAIAMALKENISNDALASSRQDNADITISKIGGFRSVSCLPLEHVPPQSKLPMFYSASALHERDAENTNAPSSSPDAPPEPDMASWFASSDVPNVGFSSAKAFAEDKNDDWLTASAPAGAVGFQSAKSMHASVGQDLEASQTDGPTSTQTRDEEVPAFTGFTTGANLLQPGKAKTATLMPSAEALAKAAKQLAQWDKEFDDEITDTSIVEELREEPSASLTGFASATGAFRPASDEVENPFLDRQPPSTPSPTGLSGFRSLSPPVSRGPSNKKKEFKSPLLTKPIARMKPVTADYIGSPLNPKRKIETRGFVVPTRVAGPSTPVRPITPLSPPKKSLGVTPRRVVGSAAKKPAFSTPFKAGMRPGETGRMALEAARPASSTVHVIGSGRTTPAPNSSKNKGKGRATYFDISKSSDRQSLATCGLRPQTYEEEELEAMGINVQELSQITPETALYYSFHTSTTTPFELDSSGPPSAISTLGVTAALNELHNAGCSLATKQWVDNHWSMVLWKLAGMVCLDPKSETDPARKRWCWREVMQQLRYRYEKELNGASRPPLRLIAAQDSPASLPMVLCVSNITWIPGDVDEHGIPTEPIPDVEVTDGWYRMRVEVDEPLLRALRKKRITVGRKIAVVGARLSAGRKDAAEILEAGESLSLRICGNSSHLAPWHAKLGFQRDPFIATLASLTSDGGAAAMLDVVIEKVYPIAYFEFIETESGERRREGPRNEKEEAAAQDKWLSKRDAAAAKLRSDVEAKLHALEGYADRLERKAGSGFKPPAEASSPDHIDDLLYELEDGPDANDIVRRVTPTEAGWLARAIRDKCRNDKECLNEDIARELNTLCPARQVRSFRVVVVRDAQTHKRPAQRSAQVTVWDVLTVYVSEDGKPGSFKEGQRFVVTNLVPTQQSAWMSRGEDSVVYLATRRDSQWRKVKG